MGVDVVAANRNNNAKTKQEIGKRRHVFLRIKSIVVNVITADESSPISS